MFEIYFIFPKQQKEFSGGCLGWNSNVKMADHYANVTTIITFKQKYEN